jgi:phospholipid/cholesterol/gamma-HCH transport system substrate-binding protein
MRKAAFLALVGAASMALAGCGFHGLYGVSLPGGADVGSHPYKIIIYFDNVLDLVPQSAVKVNDVAIGRVVQVSLGSSTGDPKVVGSPGWTAKVVVEVNGDVHLPSNARAEIAQTTLLGEKYVALEQPLDAPTATFLHNNDTIPIGSTHSAPEVEQVLGALSLLLNDGGLAQLKVITGELNKALHGNENAVRDLLSQLNTFVGQLDTQKSQITTALDQIDTLSTTLAKQTQTIADTLDTFPKALKILKDDRVKLVTLLSSLSNLGAVAGSVIDATSTTLTRALFNLSPVLEQLTAAGSNLPKALKIAGTFPFPVGKSLDALKGDYANLHLFLDLNLANELCGVSTSLCVLSSVLSSSSSSKKVSATTATPVTTQAISGPTLIGAGG